MADWQTVARRKAAKYGLDPGTFVRQIRQESGGRDVRSPAGAQGPAQFMPGTAASVGLNSRTVHQLDPSLDAAAKLMAGYVRKFGSYRNALVAYNAGPGAVGRSLPAETSNYIKVILGGSRGQTSASPSSSLPAPVAGTRTKTVIPGATIRTTIPTVDQAGFEQARKSALIGQMIARRNPNSFLLRSGLLGTTEPVLSDFTGSKTVTDKIPGATVVSAGSPDAPGRNTGPASSSKFAKSHSPLLELIHNTGSGPGFAVKNGQVVSGTQVYGDVWAGHKDHVHVAAGPKTVVELGRLAQQMGLSVGENPHFGTVHRVHAPNSYHYKGEAIDVSGNPKTMNRYAAEVERRYGLHR